MRDFVASAPYLVALSAGFVVQIYKFVAFFVRHRRVNFTRLVGTGGMPSSHSASVTALTTSVGFLEGFTSPLFSVTLFFSLVIMYDAAGLRRSAGQHAAILNRLVEERFAHPQEGTQRLIELLAHTPFEVAIGSLLGVASALAWHWIVP